MRPVRSLICGVAATTLTMAASFAAHAATILVPVEAIRIQQALDAAEDGDDIVVAAGVYDEDIDFHGKAVRVVGAGAATVIRGTGNGPVVRFASDEGPGSVLDSVLVTGGDAVQGGGIFIAGASPTIVRCVVWDNRASAAGSGIWIGDGSSARLYNNLLAYNATSGGDPHGLQISASAPVVVNNTIVRGDSNGLHVSGFSPATVRNTIFARNGSPGRGRGICDFSNGTAQIFFNDFSRNRIGAFLRNSRDWRFARTIQRERPDDPSLGDNVDGRPAFAARSRRAAANAVPTDYLLAAPDGTRHLAVDAGDPSPACNDLDGTRNDIGFTGGPFAAPSTALPGPGSCGS